MPGVRSTCGDYRVLTTLCTRAAGAAGTRHFPAPSDFKGRFVLAKLGRTARREREGASASGGCLKIERRQSSMSSRPLRRDPSVSAIAPIATSCLLAQAAWSMPPSEPTPASKGRRLRGDDGCLRCAPTLLSLRFPATNQRKAPPGGGDRTRPLCPVVPARKARRRPDNEK